MRLILGLDTPDGGFARISLEHGSVTKLAAANGAVHVPFVTWTWRARSTNSG